MIFNNETALVEELKKHKGIYIYGAGYAGQMLMKRLDRYGIDTAGFVVSDISGIDGSSERPFFVLDELKGRTDIFIVLAVTAAHREEMESNLKSKGFTSYAMTGDKLIITMDRILNKRLRFQIHLADHCNLKCRGCYHFSSLAEENFLSPVVYERDLQRLSELFDGKMDEILLLGGEPLLHPDPEFFFRLTRKYFKSGHLKILTNGLLLLKMPASFYECIAETEAELWVTKYPVNFDYMEAERHAGAFGVGLYYFNPEPVRTLGHQPLDLSGSQDYRENFYNCYRANECVDLKNGRLYPCIIPAEVEPFCRYFKVELPVSEEDSIDIFSTDSAMELLEKLERPTPFCRYCDRENISVFGDRPWSTTKFNIEEWTV